MPDYPSRPVIDVWAALRDPDVPAEVGQRLLDRQRAARNGEQPEPCPESDKPFLARHIVPAGTSRNDPERLRTVPYVSGQHRTGDADA